MAERAAAGKRRRRARPHGGRCGASGDSMQSAAGARTIAAAAALAPQETSGPQECSEPSCRWQRGAIGARLRRSRCAATGVPRVRRAAGACAVRGGVKA